MRTAEVIEQCGGSYAASLGIDLGSGRSAEIYKWLLAAVLFGPRISEASAIYTQRKFEPPGARLLAKSWRSAGTSRSRPLIAAATPGTTSRLQASR